MRKALLLYSSNDGQTREIVTRIHARLGGMLAMDLRDLRDSPPEDLSSYDAVLIGAAIRYGKFGQDVYDYAARHAEALNAKSSAFLCVCLTARKPGKRTIENNAYLRKFVRRTPWRPSLAEAVAGALLYPQYRWLDRLMIRLIMHLTDGETDPSKEVVYTDWRQVENFADTFATLAIARK